MAQCMCIYEYEVYVLIDLLMANPSKGFKWHQDNQNMSITWEKDIHFCIPWARQPRTRAHQCTSRAHTTPAS
eukprot:11337454-Ditylum_brightwellii.AAC.1